MDGINLLIERFKQDNNIETYIETVLDFAVHHEIEVEEIVDNIDSNLKKKIEVEFIKNNYFPNRKIECTLDDFFKENDL